MTLGEKTNKAVKLRGVGHQEKGEKKKGKILTLIETKGRRKNG